jgi:hypothetical protein
MAKLQISLSQAIDGYFVAAQARRLSLHTLSDYDNTFRRFETFLGNDPALASITASSRCARLPSGGLAESAGARIGSRPRGP